MVQPEPTREQVEALTETYATLRAMYRATNLPPALRNMAAGCASLLTSAFEFLGDAEREMDRMRK